MLDLDGFAFPVINVRLANHRGTATFAATRDDDSPKRTVIRYSYDQPDGSRFALKAARALWDKYAAWLDANEYLDDGEPVFIPGNNCNKGYTFTVVPARFLRGA